MLLCRNLRSRDVEAIRHAKRDWLISCRPGEPLEKARDRLIREVEQIAPWQRPEDFPAFVVTENEGPVLAWILLDRLAKERFQAHPLCRIWDLHLPHKRREQLLDGLLQAASPASYGRSLVVQLPAQARDWILCFEARDFQLQMFQIGRPVERHSMETPRVKQFRVRRAKQRDSLLLQLLCTQNLEYTLVEGQQDELESLSGSMLEALGSLDFDDPEILVLIADDIKKRRSVGYIVVYLQQPAFLFDMSVRREYWGRYVAQALVRGAENELAELGFSYLYADVSARNRRSYLTAVRSLGFKTLSQRWALTKS